MAGPIISGDVVQVTLEGRCEGQTILNVLHYKANEAESGNTYADSLNKLIEGLTDTLATNLCLTMVPLMGPNARITAIQAQRVYTQRDLYIRQPLAFDGEGTEDCDATNVAAVIVKQSSVPGRGRSGTFHLGGLAADTYALGSLTAGAKTLLQAVADRLDNKIPGIQDAEQWVPGMWNPTNPGLSSFTPIAGVTVRDTLRVMRRRTVGFGI